MRNRWWAAAFRSPDTGESSGGSGNGAPKATSANLAAILAEVAGETDLGRAVQAVLDRNKGDNTKGIEYALRAGYKARKQRDAALAENTRVAALLPATGDALFKGDEAKAVAAIVAAAKKAGLSLADLAPKIETLPTIETENANLKQEKVSTSAAAAHKLNAAALSKAVNDDGKVLFKKTVKVRTPNGTGGHDEKNEEVWHVRSRDEKEDKGVVLTEYVNGHVFKSAIMSGTQSDASSSVDWPSQGGAQSNDSTRDGLSGNLVDKTLETLNTRASAPSALNFAFGVSAPEPHSGNAAAQNAQRDASGTQRK